MVAAVSKLQRERYKTLEVKPQAVKDFFEFAQVRAYSDSLNLWNIADSTL